MRPTDTLSTSSRRTSEWGTPSLFNGLHFNDLITTVLFQRPHHNDLVTTALLQRSFYNSLIATALIYNGLIKIQRTHYNGLISTVSEFNGPIPTASFLPVGFALFHEGRSAGLLLAPPMLHPVPTSMLAPVHKAGPEEILRHHTEPTVEARTTLSCLGRLSVSCFGSCLSGLRDA